MSDVAHDERRIKSDRPGRKSVRVLEEARRYARDCERLNAPAEASKLEAIIDARPRAVGVAERTLLKEGGSVGNGTEDRGRGHRRRDLTLYRDASLPIAASERDRIPPFALVDDKVRGVMNTGENSTAEP